MSTLIDKIDGITLTKDGGEIPPSKVFDAFYGGLADLLRHNRQRSSSNQRDNSRLEQSHQQRERELFKKWRDSFPQDIEAVMTYDQGGQKTFTVQPRLNIETTFSGEAEKRGRRQREPNILFLEDNSGSETYVFRRAMTYKPGDHAFDVFNKEAGNKHDHFAYASFLPPDAKTYNHGKRGGELFLPEPFLLAGLERAFSTHDISRTTPKHGHVATDENTHTSYLLRPYLDSVRSRPAAPKKFVEYLSSMHSLGLLDTYDRQAEHYCLEKGETNPPAPIVNIDPDYIVHAGSLDQKIQHDKKNFFNAITNFQQNILEEDYDWFLTEYRQRRHGHNHQNEFRKDLVPRRISDVSASYKKQLLR